MFVLLCAVLLGAVLLWRRTSGGRTRRLADFDIGQSVSVRGVVPPENRLTVSYRGANWEAVMEDGSVPAPGDTAVIAVKTDKLLHLVLPAKRSDIGLH